MNSTTVSRSTVGPSLSPEDRTAIDTYLLRLERLQKANDWRGLLSLMAQGCITMPPRRSALEGRDAWLDWVREREFKVEDLVIDPQEFDGCGDLAFVRCNYRWTYSVKGREEPVVDSGKFMGVLRKQADDKWVGTHWMWNSDLRK